MRIAFISHWFDPEGGAAAGPGTIARALAQRGHEVHVLTGYPIYPAGKVFGGYANRGFMREELRGVTVHRTPIYPSHDDDAFRRMANYLSFSASGALRAPLILKDADVAFVYSTPATAAIPGLVLRLVGRMPMVTQVQDLWPQTVTASGFVQDRTRVGVMERVLNVYCDHVYARSRYVAVTSPGMVDLIADRGVEREKLVFIPNWAEESSFYPTTPNPTLAKQLGLRRTLTFMYAGNLGEMQNLDVIVEVASRLRDRSEIGFAFVGGGVREEHLRNQVKSRGLDNIAFVPPQPFNQMADVLALGQVQIVSLKDVPLYRSTLPSKLQANLAVGRPILGALTGDAAAVINESGAGLVCSPGNADSLTAGVLTLAERGAGGLAELGRRARAYYETKFSERVTADRLSRLLTSAGNKYKA